ncbi:MAG TPA: hypothetical protein VGO80_06365 [Solirubrobacteraceae bacterium]|nr:hypothetical protein [Solirubrobacteraceae bacterium]
MSAPPADRNGASYWLSLIEAAGLPVPDTRVVVGPPDVWRLLDGETPDGWEDLVTAVSAAGEQMGWPCFLRTAHTSGKHRWDETCWLTDPGDVVAHLVALVEDSMINDLPIGAWLIRRALDVNVLFRCAAWRGLPVTREFRVFAHGDGTIEHLQPYWPPAAFERARPDHEDWRALLAEASTLRAGERDVLEDLARRAAAAADGFWSVDLIETRDGSWTLTDMALGEHSYRWHPSGPLG